MGFQPDDKICTKLFKYSSVVGYYDNGKPYNVRIIKKLCQNRGGANLDGRNSRDADHRSSNCDNNNSPIIIIVLKI